MRHSTHTQQALEVGQRVNVNHIKTRSWESSHYLRNGVVKRIDGNRVTVHSDEKSEFSNFMSGGVYCRTAYDIGPVTKITKITKITTR